MGVFKQRVASVLLSFSVVVFYFLWMSDLLVDLVESVRLVRLGFAKIGGLVTVGWMKVCSV